ncbi:MAG: hypothetical protein UGF86_01480, partial [Bifidobacterium longum]|nr:hypothetical protein [Bifidobacterium longum]
SFPIAVCFVWRQKIVHRTRAMSLSQALNQFAQNLGRYLIGARESKFFHHLSIILSCKNSLFTCKNYCKMMKDAHKTGEAPLDVSGASPICAGV